MNLTQTKETKRQGVRTTFKSWLQMRYNKYYDSYLVYGYKLIQYIIWEIFELIDESKEKCIEVFGVKKSNLSCKINK